MRRLWVLGLSLAIVGCSASTTHVTKSSSTIPGTTPIPEDYDAAKEMATAAEVRDRLDEADIACDGEPEAVEQHSTGNGNVAALECTVDDQTISIGVFRSPDEVNRFLSIFESKNCVLNAGKPAYYVADDNWVITVNAVKDNTTSEATAKPIADALVRPVEALDLTCPAL